MPVEARQHLQRLVGTEIRTSTGKPNRVLGVDARTVTVATNRSPRGRPVPIEWVENAMDILAREGEVTIDVATLGYRSSFIGAVLATLPGAVVLATSPPRISLGRHR